MRLSLSRIEEAATVLSPTFSHSPQQEDSDLGSKLGCRILLKDETRNPIRCFKGRGAEIAIRRAIEAGSQSFVCASAGNLGQAVAYCSRQFGLRAIVVAARSANATKLEQITTLGADLRLVDGDIENARDSARDIAQTERAFLIEDSENIGTCEGAGTIGLELLDHDCNEPLDAIVIALGGGAMATGIGCVFKNRSPNTRIICVQPSGAPAMTLSWKARKVITTDNAETIADGVAGRYPIPEVLADLLEVADDALLVEESSIMEGMRLLYRKTGLVVEPSAALGIAAILENKSRFHGKRVASILCGANVDINDFENWVR